MLIKSPSSLAGRALRSSLVFCPSLLPLYRFFSPLSSLSALPHSFLFICSSPLPPLYLFFSPLSSVSVLPLSLTFICSSISLLSLLVSPYFPFGSFCFVVSPISFLNSFLFILFSSIGVPSLLHFNCFPSRRFLPFPMFPFFPVFLSSIFLFCTFTYFFLPFCYE